MKSILTALLIGTSAAPAVADLSLVMVEQRGCAWCARWNAEIAPAYGNTDEGQAAPLRRVQLGAIPDDLDLESKVRFTPTFVLVDEGTEIGRIEGYPGEDFFWPMLGALLTKADEIE